MQTMPHSSAFKKRVLVTGGRGFIGTALCQLLRQAGAEVWSVGRSAPGKSDEHALVADLQSIDATRNAYVTAEPDYVFHLAGHAFGARSPDLVLYTYHSNLTSTVNLLLVAQENQCQRVVLTGSLEEPEPSGEWTVPSSPYAASKFAVSAYGRMFDALFGLSVVTLRVFMVYGPGQRDEKKLIPYVITSLLKGERLSLTSGQREVDWIYVDDVAEAYLHASTAPGIDGTTLDVGTGETATVREVVERLFSRLGVDSQLQFGSIDDRPMEQIRRADVERSRQMMGWSPRTSLDKGLRATIAWYRDRQAKLMTKLINCWLVIGAEGS